MLNPHMLLRPMGAFIAFAMSQEFMKESSLSVSQINVISGIIALATLTLLFKATNQSEEALALRGALIKEKAIAVTQRAEELHEAAFIKNLAFVYAVLAYSMSVGFKGLSLYLVIDTSISALTNNAMHFRPASLALTATSLALIEKSTMSEEFKHHKEQWEKDIAVSVAEAEIGFLNPIKKGVASLLIQVGFKDIHQKNQPEVLENVAGKVEQVSNQH